MEKLSWKEIQDKYPDTWIGLTNVEFEENNSSTIKSAVVKYTDKSKNELTKLMIKGEIIAKYTTPDNVFQLGAI